MIKLKELLTERKVPIKKNWRFGFAIIEFFDSMRELKPYRDRDASYDDPHYTIPLKDFKRIVGWTEKEVEQIDDRIEDYEGYIGWGKDAVIVGGSA
jgi:hypothetical protein